MRWLAVVALVGCKFTPGELRDDSEEAAVVRDGPAGNCYARWFDGSIRFGQPSALIEANSLMYDRDPYLAADEQTFYVSSGRAGGMGGTVWVATRPSRTAPFSMPTVEPSFESAGNETKLSITADGLYAVVGSDRDNANSVDVWEGSRASVNDSWPSLTRDHVAAVNTAGADHDPTISADGLRLYLAPSSGYQYIAVATRADRGANFGAPAEIAELTSMMGDADPSTTPDERIMLFSSGRAAAALNGNVWYATRASNNGVFGAPQIVPDVNTDLSEGDPHLSADGCRLYFGREVDPMTYDWDIFVATALP